MNAKWGSFFLTYSWKQDGKLLATSILYIFLAEQKICVDWLIVSYPIVVSKVPRKKS